MPDGTRAPRAPAADDSLVRNLERTAEAVGRVLRERTPGLGVREVGVVRSVGPGTARVEGLSSVTSDEVVEIGSGVPAIVFNLDPGEVGVILLGKANRVEAGDDVRRTGETLRVPVGAALLGRAVDPLGRPLDGKGRVRGSREREVERPAPEIMARAPVERPLQTGLKVVDALVPVGRGQRELILGDRQTGKTALAVDAILNQTGTDVLCVYCAIGQRGASVARVVARLEEAGALAHSIVVAAGGEESPGLQYVAPYAATTMAEHFMLEEGRDVLIVYDDLTRHARAYRELSLLLRRPPGREGYPGDVFHIHARLLERATHLREEFGGGSLTALPVVEIQGGDVAAYIPTNLISITDGQIYLSPELFQKGILPAVDVGRSVSRVGGDAQLPAYRAVVRDLRLSYSQFQELEVFSRFEAQLDEETRGALHRGRRIREVLKQAESSPLDVPEQIAVLVAATEGILDEVEVDAVGDAEERIRHRVRERLPELCRAISAGERLDDADLSALRDTIRQAVAGAGP